MFAYLEHFAVMSRGVPNPSSLAEIGDRLRITRKALGHTQAVMAGIVNSSTDGTVWANYEAGRRRISLDQALALCSRLGLTLDWIYRGNVHTLPGDIIERIQLVMRDEQQKRRKATRP